MPIEITMPRLSDTMEEGTLVKWRVQVGDQVKSGDLLADIETDKATMELQSYDDGTVASLALAEGQSAPVGALMLVLAAPGEKAEEIGKSAGTKSAGHAPPAAGADKPAAQASQAPAEPVQKEAQEKEEKTPETPAGQEAPAEPQAPAAGEGHLRVSPLAQKLAEERGVDLKSVRGSGPGGRVIKRDIPSASGTAPPPAPSPATRPPTGAPQPPQRGPLPARPAQPAAAGAAERPGGPPGRAPGAPAQARESRTVALSNMRKTIARRLVESKTTIPHFTVTVRVDMDFLLGPRGAKKQLETQGIKISVNDFVCRAAVLALLQHPGVNASWTDQGILQHGTINLGVAVALPAERGGGLVVPTIRDAQDLPLRALAAEVRRLSEKARTTGLTLEEMAEGTFTLSNMGMFGVDHFEAIINPPQAAILAIGAALDQAIVRDGAVAIGKQMTCTISADHRVIDGVMAAGYLQTLKQMLENPAVLLV